jgi:nucleoside-diphosphate-sugar epimerase
MTYIDDLIRGLQIVSAWNPREVQPVNLGNEHEYSVGEIINRFNEVTGLDIEVVYQPARPEDPQRRRPVTSIAESLGWSADVQLAEGLVRTYQWFVSDALQYA